MQLNISPLKELGILINGPLYQFIAYFLLLWIFKDKKVVISIYHYGILLFNLLPIYPLDGGKLINLLFQFLIPYKRSLQLEILISYLILLLITIYTKILLLNKILFLIFVFFLITKEAKKINYNYNKFLLERYLYKYNFSKEKIINNENSFYRNRNHIIKQGSIYITEREYLEKKYKKIL